MSFRYCRIIMTAIVLLSSSSLGGSKKYTSLHVDQMTGDSSWVMKKPVYLPEEYSSGGIKIWAVRFIGNEYGERKHDLVLMVDFVGNKDCVDQGDDANVLFENGDRLLLIYGGSFSCDGSWFCVLGLKGDSDLDELLSKRMKRIRINWMHGFVEVAVDKSSAQKICDTLSELRSVE
jgi:hypothetical protein